MTDPQTTPAPAANTANIVTPETEMSVTVDLTATQQLELAEIMRQAKTAANGGKPGMVIAQVFHSRMIVAFLPGDRAIPLAKKDGDKACVTVG